MDKSDIVLIFFDIPCVNFDCNVSGHQQCRLHCGERKCGALLYCA